MKERLIGNRKAQLIVVLLCVVALKFYYATASVNQLRWILAPTTRLVELVTGARFAFESNAGYMSSDHTFLIAASCAGVNFLIAAFLMLSVRKAWIARAPKIGWQFIPVAALAAYVTTIVANTVRISTALLLRRTPLEIGLNPNQIHRFEGILVYFGFLLLLFMVSENLMYRTATNSERITRIPSKNLSGLLRQSFFPLMIYYATTLAMPLANGAYHQGADFWEHFLFVFLTPLLLVLPFAAFCFIRNQWSRNV
jgi:exosortase K